MTFDYLPDSRLAQRPDFGCVMGDWRMADGSTIRCEQQPIYCCGCGKLFGYIPRENTVQATYICKKCYDNDPFIFNGLVVSDEQFMRDVQYEMQARFGHDLTDGEVYNALQDHNLGPALEALLRDSPYPARDNRPKGTP